MSLSRSPSRRARMRMSRVLVLTPGGRGVKKEKFVSRKEGCMMCIKGVKNGC